MEYIKSMTFAEWSENLSVEIDLIDDQHKVLIDMINEIARMILNKNSKKAHEVIDELKSWTEKHFSEEEEMFTKTAYPDADKHKKEHSYFIQKVNDLSAEEMESDFSVSLNILQFLKNWLFYHIEIIDKTYAPYVIKILKET